MSQNEAFQGDCDNPVEINVNRIFKNRIIYRRLCTVALTKTLGLK